MGKRININTMIIGASVLTLGVAVYYIASAPVDKKVSESHREINYQVESLAENSLDLTLSKTVSESGVQQNGIDTPKNSDQKKSIFTSNTFVNTQEYEAASRFGLLPSNMRDVSMEQFEYDEQGKLVLSSKVKNIVEFFLLASESEGYEQAVARLEEYIELTLPDTAQGQALELVHNYLSYKQNMKDQSFPMTTDLADVETLREIRNALGERKKLRREYLGEEVSEALFGYEERYDDFSLTRVEINGNLSLSPDEKDRLLEEAEQALPEQLAKKMRYQREERRLKNRIEALKETGDNVEEIYNLRKDFYGQAVADRYAYLEDNSPEWQGRVSDFYSVQQQIMKDATLSPQERTKKVQQLKQDSFTKQERVKLAVQSIRAMI